MHEHRISTPFRSSWCSAAAVTKTRCGKAEKLLNRGKSAFLMLNPSFFMVKSCYIHIFDVKSTGFRFFLPTNRAIHQLPRLRPSGHPPPEAPVSGNETPSHSVTRPLSAQCHNAFSPHRNPTDFLLAKKAAIFGLGLGEKVEVSSHFVETTTATARNEDTQNLPS